MRKRSWSKTLRDFGRNLEDTWDDLIHDDTSQLEREFNRLVGRLQRRHGYSPDHALHELQNQWNNYSKRTRSLLERQLDSLPIHRKQKSRRWPWVLGAIIGAMYITSKLLPRIGTQNNSHLHRNNGYQGKHQQRSDSPEERTSVEERSRESFPASDPPATW